MSARAISLPLHSSVGISWLPQVALVDATATFLQRGAQGQLEHARPLVQWLVQAAASPAAPVRAAVLRHAALFAEPQVWIRGSGAQCGLLAGWCCATQACLWRQGGHSKTFPVCPPCGPGSAPRWGAHTSHALYGLHFPISPRIQPVHMPLSPLPGHPGAVPRGGAPHPHQGPGGNGGGPGGAGKGCVAMLHGGCSARCACTAGYGLEAHRWTHVCRRTRGTQVHWRCAAVLWAVGNAVAEYA